MWLGQQRGYEAGVQVVVVGDAKSMGTDKPAAWWEDAAYLISIYASGGSRDVI